MSENQQTLYPGSKHEKIRERSNFFRRNLWAVISTGIAILEAIVLIVVLVLFRPSATPNITSGPTPTPSVTPTPEQSTPTPQQQNTSTPQQSTPTPTTPTQTSPVGSVLCQYDATHSFSDWSNSPQWKQVNNGMLGSAGTDADNSQGPENFLAWSGCKLLTPNYAVEAQIQYVRSTKLSNGIYVSNFGIMLRGDGKTSGYEIGVGMDDCKNSQVVIAIIQPDQSNGSMPCNTSSLTLHLPGSGSSHNYNVDTGWHTFRAEVSNNTIRLSIDKNKLLETSDNTFTDAGQVGLRDLYGDINVRSFIVTAL